MRCWSRPPFPSAPSPPPSRDATAGRPVAKKNTVSASTRVCPATSSASVQIVKTADRSPLDI
jgi:hypothetical protein